MDLGIAIVSYNTRRLTEDCLASVYCSLAGASLQARVWVVDNASMDGSAAMVRDRFPQATLIASERNLGFAGGTNLAAEQMVAEGARPRYLMLLNPDTVVHSDALERMVRFMDLNSEVGVAGARLLNADGSLQHSAFHFPTLLMTAFDFVQVPNRVRESCLNGRYPQRRYERGMPFAIDHPLGAVMLIRWKTWEQVGALDTGFFMYCEEIDWCMRARRLGWRCLCVPQAVVTHFGGQSARQFRDAMYVALWTSRKRLFDKHYGRAYQWAAGRIARLGMRSCTKLAVDLRTDIQMTAAEAEGRLSAYRQVEELFGG